MIEKNIYLYRKYSTLEDLYFVFQYISTTNKKKTK